MRLPSSPVFVALVIVAALFAAPGASVDPESLPLLSIMQAHLDAIQSSFGFLSPPGVSRALSMHTEAVWNAVMPYTETLLPTLELEVDRRPVAEHTQANRATAATMAAYCVVKDLFVNHQSHLAELEDVFAASGLSASDAETEDSHTPVGIGNRACRKVLEYRHKDGMNQLGDEMNSNGPYSDYTLYYPVNDPQPTLVRTNCSQLRSIDRWQPLRVPTPDGREVTRQFLAPYMARVTPFALSAASEFRPDPPAMYAAGGAAREQFIEQHTAVLNYSATLDDYQKVVAEFFADGPDSTLPPGHSISVAMELARERNLGFVDTVKSMFVVAQAIMDAGIASWEAKRYYDSVRPIVAIQCLFQNQMVKAWAGPYQGVQMIDGGGWQPYQESHFKTPPFAELPSGHSSFSGSMAGVLRRFYGTDEYGGEYTIKAGESLFEPAVLDPSDPRYVAGETDVPNQGPETKGYVPATDITLRWETLTDFANDAGISRLYGGIHIRDGDMFGRTLGAQVAEKVWNKYRTLLVDGSAGATTGTTAGSASSSSSSSSSSDTVDTTEVLTYALIGSFVGSAVVAMLFGAIIVWFVRDMNTTRQSKERKFQTSTTRDLRANEDVDDDDVVKEEMELPAV